VYRALTVAHTQEASPVGQTTLQLLVDNADYARHSGVALCQDGGVTLVFLEIGQAVHLVDGLLEDAVQAGVRRGYQDGYLRGSMLDRPFGGHNTGDNTPAILYTRLVAGDQVTITVMPKGGGAENTSRLAMFTPAQGMEAIRDFVLDTIVKAGPASCPPLIVGIGVGGSFDYVGQLAKRALLRDIGTPNPDPALQVLEEQWLDDINQLGIGPQGYGGTVTALAVHLAGYARHIASIPVAVNLQCHAARKGTVVL
jgi:fumarate hydratase subunit alpha